MSQTIGHMGAHEHIIKIKILDVQSPCFVYFWRKFVCLFVCLGGRQGEADELDCNPLQRVGIPFFRDLASRPRTLLLLFNPRWF